MRFIMSLFWAVLISGVVSYVLTNMGGEPFNLTHSLILAGILFIAVVVLGEFALRKQED
ncbi:DUF2929 family protein [Ornithinibacillus sp. 4-3]|uniref:DUF2929 family protein n=1 Tax=Ornithinibacillus sp. 4-3 TaxID=3231488 RepID=A0AB39HU72_9BACI